jgi:hypothetical protein
MQIGDRKLYFSGRRIHTKGGTEYAAIQTKDGRISRGVDRAYVEEFSKRSQPAMAVERALQEEMQIADVAKKYDEIKREANGSLGWWPLLAGGAIRSALMGEEPKDWDLYVDVRTNSVDGHDSGETAEEEDGIEFHKQLAEKFDAIAAPAPEEYQIHGLAPAGHFIIAGVDCNVILFDREVISKPTENFDFISSTGMYTGSHFENLDEVAGDIARGVLRINNHNLNKKQVNSSLGRIEKFKERYGWELDTEAKAQFLRWRGEFYLLD